MKFKDRINLIIKETFSSPNANSYITNVEGKNVVLRAGGKFKNVNLRGANLSNARLPKIDLEGADLSGTILVGADLSGANLTNVKFDDAIVSGANFTNAKIDRNELNCVKADYEPIGVKIIKGKVE